MLCWIQHSCFVRGDVASFSFVFVTLRHIYVMGSQLHNNHEWDYNLRVASLIPRCIDVLSGDSSPCEEICVGANRPGTRQGAITVQLDYYIEGGHANNH